MRTLPLLVVAVLAAVLLIWSPWSDPAAPAPAPGVAGQPVGHTAEDGPSLEHDAVDLETPAPTETREEVATTPEAAPATDTGAIRGRVTDGDGRAIPGARVIVARQIDWFDRAWFRDPTAPIPERVRDAVEVAADANGRFDVAPRSADDPLSVLVVAPRHTLQRKKVPATGGEAIDVGDFRLPLGVVVEGRVIDDEGRPVVGAGVTLAGRGAFVLGGDRDVRGAKTGANGTFSVLLESPGDYELVARHPHHADGSHAGTAARRGDAIRGVTIQLGATADIVGKLTAIPADVDELEVRAMKIGAKPDSPVRGVELDFEMPLRFANDRAEVSPDGTFRLRGLERGETYRLAAFDHGSSAWRGSRVSDVLELASGTADARLAYQQGVRVVFDAVDAATGESVTSLQANADIDEKGGPMQVVTIGNFSSGESIQPGEDGRFRLPPIRPDADDRTFSLTVAATGFAEWKRERIPIPASGELDLGRLELRAAPILRVRVTDAAGEPIAKARVRFEADDAGRGAGGSFTMRTVTTDIAVGDDAATADFGSLGGIRRGRGRTDENGICELTLEPGTRGRPVVRHRDYAPSRGESVVVPQHGSVESDIRLTAGGTAVVTVVDSDGAVVAGARLSCQEVGSVMTTPRFAETDTTGVARFDRLADGLYKVEFRNATPDGVFAVRTMTRTSGDAEAPAEAPANSFRIELGNTAQLRMVQPAKSTLVGTVTIDGEPISGARVAAKKVEGGGPDIAALMGNVELPGLGGGLSARTDGSGQFEIQGVDAGPIRLVVTHPRRVMPAEIEVVAVEGETRCDIALQTTRIVGRVVDTDGEPVERARVSVQRAETGNRQGGGGGQQVRIAFTADTDGGGGLLDSGGRSIRTDIDGTFELEGVLTDTPLVVGVSSPKYADATSENLTLSPGETRRDVEIVVSLGGTLDVRLAGEPGPFTFVIATREDGQGSPKTAMAQNGKAKLRGLGAGRWTVRVRGRDGQGDERTVEVSPGETTTVELTP